LLAVKGNKSVLGQSLPVYVIAVALIAIAAVAATSLYSMSLMSTVARESTGSQVEGPTSDDKKILLPIRGSGTIRYTPDKATFTLGVEARGETVLEASDKMSRQMNSVISSLLANGVPEKNIKTSYLSVGPYWECKPDTGCQQNGYIASSQITVVLEGRLLADSAKILGDAIGAGATQLWGVTFDLTDETKARLRDTALKNALADASSKATALAGLMNLQIKGIKHITVSFPEEGYPFVPMPVRAVEAGAPGSQGPTVMPGEATYQVTVEITYILEPAQ
jgi:uncharacterized protein YggE